MPEINKGRRNQPAVLPLSSLTKQPCLPLSLSVGSSVRNRSRRPVLAQPRRPARALPRHATVAAQIMASPFSDKACSLFRPLALQAGTHAGRHAGTSRVPAACSPTVAAAPFDQVRCARQPGPGDRSTALMVSRARRSARSAGFRRDRRQILCFHVR